MGDLSKNLSRSEFECQCGYPECNRTPVDFALVDLLQECVNHFSFLGRNGSRRLMFQRVVCHITSGYRCPAHNTDIGGSPTSTHMLGIGADHWLENIYSDGTREKVPADQVADYYQVKYPGELGLVRYDDFTHVDVRPVAYRGDRRS